MSIIDIPLCFYTKPILTLIDHYIEDGFKSYIDLDHFDRERLTIECMKALGNDAEICITSHPDFHKTLSLLIEYIEKGTSAEGYDLLNVLRKNARESFTKELNELFSERYDQIQYENNKIPGLPIYRHTDNNETIGGIYG